MRIVYSFGRCHRRNTAIVGHLVDHRVPGVRAVFVRVFQFSLRSNVTSMPMKAIRDYGFAMFSKVVCIIKLHNTVECHSEAPNHESSVSRVWTHTHTHKHAHPGPYNSYSDRTLVSFAQHILCVCCFENR